VAAPEGAMLSLLLADAVLALHFCIVIFVVGGLPLIWIGNARGWRRVNGYGFRLSHLAAIGIVATQAWLGVLCPLTTLEMWLRAQAGAATYGGSFIAHWVQRALYYDAPAWVFIALYTAFAAAVAATWWRFPPQRG